MKVACPKCGGEIAAVDVNMTAGVLFCPSQKRQDYMENALRYLLRERAAVQV